jgi:hypothetical protein
MDRIQAQLNAGRGGTMTNLKVIYAANKNSDSYRWLQVVPKFVALAINNTAFKNAFCMRYLIPIRGLADRSKCNLCGNVMDVYGYHFAHGCSMSGCFNLAHEELKYCFRNILVDAGIHTTVEERGIFNDGISDSTRQCPDLFVSLPQSTTTFTKSFVDVSVISKFTIGQNGIGGVYPKGGVDKDAAVRIRAKAKLKKYHVRCAERNIQCVPFVFDTTGHMHSDSKKFLKTVAKTASVNKNNRISADVLYNYYMKVLTICLMKSLGNSVHKAMLGIYNNSSQVGIMNLIDREEVDEAINNHAVVHL